MAVTTVYAENGATFNCDTQERLNHYLKAGWSTKPIKQARGKRSKAEPGKEE